MSQACAMWRGDIGACIVGALEADASARVRRHLRACQACRDDYHDLVLVRDWLGRLLLPGEERADDLRDEPSPEPSRRPLRRGVMRSRARPYAPSAGGERRPG